MCESFGLFYSFIFQYMIEEVEDFGEDDATFLGADLVLVENTSLQGKIIHSDTFTLTPLPPVGRRSSLN